MAGALFTIFGCALSFFLVPLFGTPSDRFFGTWVACSLIIGAIGGLGGLLLVATDKE